MTHTTFDAQAFVAEALRLHEQDVERFMGAAAAPEEDAALGELGEALIANHYANCRLWREEDQVRRTDVADAQVVASKRAIDRFNQARNDAVERLDEALLACMPVMAPQARVHSETPGAMLDRLSILTLKVHHMALQTTRADASDEHRARCGERLSCLHRQRADLAVCLCELLQSIQRGQARFSVYRQFKMYNDSAYRATVAGTQVQPRVANMEAGTMTAR
jgi:Protein of unknown function (DUF4254)